MPAAVGPMIAARVPAATRRDTSFRVSFSPNLSVTCESPMSPRKSATRVPRGRAGGAASTMPIRMYDALDCAMTLLMKPIMITGKIRIAR